MQLDQIRTVAVLGAGTMGNGIAHVFARAGYKVILRDVERKYLDRAMDTINKNLEREVKKGKIDEAEKGNTFARLQPVVEMSAIAVADFAVEAVPEKIEIKRAVLTEADKILREGVVIASNTSSIAMTALAALTKRPERFVGMHFMNPVPVMKLGMNHPMGPLELADFIGLDVCVDILNVLLEGLGDPKYRACPLLKKYVAAGWLGRKSGRGFYSYAS